LTSPTDPYREWDVAYVLGSLSPSDRRTYERHLGECPACERAVTGLAGMPGILSVVPTQRAVELLGPPAPDQEVPNALLPGLIRAAHSARRWARVRVAAAVLVAAAAGALLAIVLRPQPPSPPDPAPAHAIALTQTIPSPVTARVILVEQPWGTRIDITCDYTVPPDGRPSPTFVYSLHVVDRQGVSTTVATWTAGPGTSMKPIASTGVPLIDITRIEVRLVLKDTVLLEARF
jgi:putative zinc finger protein